MCQNIRCDVFFSFTGFTGKDLNTGRRKISIFLFRSFSLFLWRNDEGLQVEWKKMTLASYSASSTGATSASPAMRKILPSNCLGLQTESAVSPSKSHPQETLMIPEDLLVQDDSSIGATSFSRQQCVP